MTPAPRTVFIYSKGEKLGDGLIKLPAIAALRAAWPDAHITWCAAAEPTVYTGALAEIAAPLLDEITDGDGLGGRLTHGLRPPPSLRGKRYDLVIDTQRHIGRSLAVSRLPAGRRITAGGGMHEEEALADQILDLFSRAADRKLAALPVRIADAEAEAAARTLAPEGALTVALAPGAQGEERRWPLDDYLALAARLRGRGVHPVILIGPGETEMAEPARAAGFEPPAAVMEGGPMGVKTVIALGERLVVGVANDSGMGHMLAAGGSSLVSLFRETRKAKKFRPASPRVLALVAEAYGAKDMTRIPLDAVERAVMRFVEEA